MLDDIRQAGPGPLSSVQDPVVARELRNLWSVVTARSGQTGGEGQKWVTIDELNAAKREVLGKMPTDVQKPSTQPQGGDATISGGLDLRPLNNKWTGTQLWDKPELVASPYFKFRALTSGPITSFTTPTSVLQEDDKYQATVCIQKSSESSVFYGRPNAALHVQHRGGGETAQAVGIIGIKSVAESITVTPAPGVNNTVTAGWFTCQNATRGGLGFGLKVEIAHKGTANGNNGAGSFGIEVLMYRVFLDGKVTGVHVRPVYDGTYWKQPADYGFLASPHSWGVGRINIAFSAGSDYIGLLPCSIGLDLAYASCDLAAIRIGQSKKLTFNGGGNNVGMYFEPDPGKLQFFSNIGDTVAIGNDGSVRIQANKRLQLNDKGAVDVCLFFADYGAIVMQTGGTTMFGFGTDGSLYVGNPATIGTAGRLMGYWEVNLGGFNRYIPFHSF